MSASYFIVICGVVLHILNDGLKWFIIKMSDSGMQMSNRIIQLSDMV